MKTERENSQLDHGDREKNKKPKACPEGADLRTVKDGEAMMDVNVHTLCLEKVNERAILGQHRMNLVPVFGEAAEHSLHAPAGAIEVYRVVNRKNIHLESAWC
jgi:hypothetical protein